MQDCKTFDSILDNYSMRKQQTEVIQELICNNDLFRSSFDMLHCGDNITFALVDGEYRLVAADFCRKRICPMCMWRKADKQFSRTVRLAEQLQDDYAFIHLVLTVPNCDSSAAAETVNKLYRSFSKFIKYKECKRAFKGVIRALEVTINPETYQLHPHLHNLVVVNKSYFNDSKQYLSHDKLVELWARATGVELPQVSVSRIRDTLGFAEVCKYCVKPLDLTKYDEVASIELLTTLNYTLKGKRFLQSYGVCKDILQAINEEDKGYTAAALSSAIQMFDYRYNNRLQRYIQI